jgi:hypothetical protein
MCMGQRCLCMDEIRPSFSIRWVVLFSCWNRVNHFGSLKGFGTLLMEEAERIAREEHGSIKLAVISGEV